MVTVVTLSFVTLAFVLVARACGAGDDGDLKSENENKHEVTRPIRVRVEKFGAS